MKLIPTDGYNKDLEKLTKDEALQVNHLVVDIEGGKLTPGTREEKIIGDPQRRLFSYRVNKDLRLVVHKHNSEEWWLAIVGHHEHVYDKAKRWKISTDVNGKPQIEVIKEKTVTVTRPVLPPLFSDISEFDLRQLGVPDAVVPAVKAARTDDELVELLDHYPVNEKTLNALAVLSKEPWRIKELLSEAPVGAAGGAEDPPKVPARLSPDEIAAIGAELQKRLDAVVQKRLREVKDEIDRLHRPRPGRKPSRPQPPSPKVAPKDLPSPADPRLALSDAEFDAIWRNEPSGKSGWKKARQWLHDHADGIPDSKKPYWGDALSLSHVDELRDYMRGNDASLVWRKDKRRNARRKNVGGGAVGAGQRIMPPSSSEIEFPDRMTKSGRNTAAYRLFKRLEKGGILTKKDVSHLATQSPPILVSSPDGSPPPNCGTWSVRLFGAVYFVSKELISRNDANLQRLFRFLMEKQSSPMSRKEILSVCRASGQM